MKKTKFLLTATVGLLAFGLIGCNNASTPAPVTCTSEEFTARIYADESQAVTSVYLTIREDVDGYSQTDIDDMIALLTAFYGDDFSYVSGDDHFYLTMRLADEELMEDGETVTLATMIEELELDGATCE